ncbi:cytochrome c oxidase subunit 2A [Neobacillus terrae]|uniref:cytochrome c oxidase subunit 2A n=1 Tax=Neobacillus terrae TaxID=3034837 RepID=UPI0014080D9C|nr:cytochrome c oxidase subunit 2A [Neobacillus terrae]NHM29186.1 cytochrome c oxidase subunit 2A [Neobacillus terrae]
MAKAQLKNGPKSNPKVQHKEESESLKGTMASVMFLGFFIIVTWLGVYFLFVDRF